MKKLLFVALAGFLFVSGLFAGGWMRAPEKLDGTEEVPGWPVDIYPEKPQQVFRVYPNPVREDIKVAYDLKESVKVNMEIRDITGKKVMEESFDNLDGQSELTLGLSALREGIYFMKFYSEDSKLYQIIKIQKL